MKGMNFLLIKQKVLSIYKRGSKLLQYLFDLPLINHILSTYLRFNARLGSNFSAAITYFFFLSLIPLLMLVFAFTGSVLARHPDILAKVINGIISFIREPHLDEMLESMIKTAISQRTVVGVSGICIAMYSGMRLMAVLREAIVSQFSENWPLQQHEKEPFYIAYPKNFLRLLGFGVVFTLIIVVTSLKGTIRHDITWLFSSLNVIDDYWFILMIRAITLTISLLANVILFVWLYRFLSFKRALNSAFWMGCSLASMGLEGIKLLVTFIVPRLMKSPTGVAFGSIIGLLAMLYLFAWLTLFCAAWIATSERKTMSLNHIK